jgi:hypothetical protein
MMFVRSRFVLFIVLSLILVLTACAGPFGKSETLPVDAATFSATMQYVDIGEIGPAYNVTLTLPDEWVGKMEVRNIGNSLAFNRIVDSGLSKPLFYIEALSSEQYWQSSGSYPASNTNIINLGDTFFVYSLPIDEFHSGLSAEDLSIVAAQVPAVIASFNVEAAN